MPCQISVAIDVSGKLRKLMGKSRKNKTTDQPEIIQESTIKFPNSVEESSVQANTDHSEKTDRMPVYESEEFKVKDLVSQINRVHEQTSLLSNSSIGNSERIISTSGSEIKKNNIDCKNSETKGLIANFFKNLFVTGKQDLKKQNTSNEQMCDTALDTFSTLLKDDSSLDSLIGKEFSLNTVVTIKAVEDGGQPNLVLTGSIPFQLATEKGIEHKRVRIRGKLYSPRKDTILDERRNPLAIQSSTQSLILCKINDTFKRDSSIIKEVDWLTSEVFTQEEFQKYLWTHGLREHTTAMDDQAGQRGGVEQLTYISDIDRERSLNFIERKRQNAKADPSPYKTSTKKTNDTSLPVTSITITRSKTRLTKFADGTDHTEKVGRYVVTLATPEGILYFPNGVAGASKDNTDRTSFKCDDIFTQAYFQMIRDERFSQILTKKCLSQNSGKEPQKQTEELNQTTHYPPNDYTEILSDRYNPLTWIYKNFGKTKRFIQGFSVVK